ncbi:complement C5 [Notolabrus celidotus]|uniref:complement C5 n=1 Tax=Notolabrus celidotus TaxID=1203425 RepID=UPI0014901257|nr:complement C5 [Notolabrus celidotus]
MRVCVVLMCVFCLWWRTEADPRSYLVTAPLSLRLDSLETVLVQLFGFTEEVSVYVFLKTSMAPDQVVLAKEVVTLNAQNNHQAAASVRLHPGELDKSVNHVILHVQSAEINEHLSIPVSRSNGFLFIQTDKPLYTPHQSVKVRVFSLNQELRPANRSVFLTFKDPDHTTVDIVEMFDINNGMPSMQNPFKIPIKPKLGIWTIEAAYSDEFTTTAKTDFEVKEYVLPSFSIEVEPEVNYISYGQFTNFNFKVSARYLHGAPVAGGEVFLRYGYVTGKSSPVIIPSSVSRERLSPTGEVDVTVNMEKVMSKHSVPKDLLSLVGSYLYIAVLLHEDTGGISQEAEFAVVKFVESPYRLSLVSTPPFIKPGLPYNIQVLVKDHLDQPVNRVQVRAVEQQVFSRGGESEELSGSNSAVSQSDGLAFFIYSIPGGKTRATLKFETADPTLPAASQASLTLEATAYHSPNERYIYIDPPLSGLEVGQYTNIKVYSATPSHVPLRALSYLVVSKGKVVTFGNQKVISNTQNLNFQVTASMVPSIRLLVYYILFGEGTSELVADSVWLDVKAKCVNDLQADLSFRELSYKPKDNLNLDIKTNQDGLVALSAVDTGLFTLRTNFKDPVSRVLRHIEASDQGCGGGGGIDSADVFRLAGLTFITKANARPSSSNAACTAVVRPKRALTEEAKTKKAHTFGRFKRCCENGMMYLPRAMTCEQLAKQLRHVHCRAAFQSCCEFLLQHLEQDNSLTLGRSAMGANFDLAPSLVRSYFPESWMWEVQRVSPRKLSIARTLPDTLTTWEIKAVMMSKNGICVAEPVQVSVSLPLSVDVPLPYQVVRGEQLELRGSVYNQQADSIQYCVTLTAGPALCLLQSQPSTEGSGLHTTACTWSRLTAEGVGAVTFTVLGLEPGEHTLTFTLKTRGGEKDIVEKKLRVVPEGTKKESFSGGRLDPQGLYGSEKRVVELKYKVPANIVPNTAVESMLTINGEVLGDAISVVHDPKGLRQLVNLPAGSAEAELGGILPLIQVYKYLETTGSWDTLGEDIQKNSADLRQRIKDGLVSISSFRAVDCSYSMWAKREPSTWLTAMVVKTLSVLDPVIPVDHQSLSESVSWLIYNRQQTDGSFTDQSSFRPNKIMAKGMDAVDQSVYLTSFVLIALHKATRIKDQILQLRFHDDSMSSAANYISKHALGLKSMYVRAVATYALTLNDPNSVTVSSLILSLENLAQQKGHPASLRYWQEPSVTADWLKPDQSSGLTVEMTAYVLLTMLLKGRIPYANPILTWLTQDQHYGEGFYSIQDTVLTLEAVTEYSRVIPRAVLNQDINVRFSRSGELRRIQLSQSRSVARPIQVMKNDVITVSTGYGRGVSNVKLKTVYYEIASSSDGCNFDITIELAGPGSSNNPSTNSPHLVACAKYKPPPNEVFTESTLTVMEIQMPTGVDAFLEDLRQFRDSDEPIISHYELRGNTVVIQMESVPSDMFMCVGFRIRIGFNVRGVSESLFSVYEPQDKGSMCTKPFSYVQQKLQRFCVEEQCQCMTAACPTYRATFDSTLTAVKRIEETCQPHIKYAYRVTVTSSAAEGDFTTYTATVDEVLKNTDKDFEAVTLKSEVYLIQKVTCNAVNIQNNKQYLVMGARGSEVTLNQGYKYRLTLDSEALVDLWPKDCSTPECSDYIAHLEDFALELQLSRCPDSL